MIKNFVRRLCCANISNRMVLPFEILVLDWVGTKVCSIFKGFRRHVYMSYISVTCVTKSRVHGAPIKKRSDVSLQPNNSYIIYFFKFLLFSCRCNFYRRKLDKRLSIETDAPCIHLTPKSLRKAWIHLPFML